MKHKILEVCVDSLASALAAERGGADRLELCGCLAVGGLTPDVALLEQIKEQTKMNVRCLMRPRLGDFCYTEDELPLLVRQIWRLSDAGADGFVIGWLTPEGDLDMARMERLVKAANGKGLTLHRCIDVSRDAVKTLRDAAELGIDTVLTSGQAPSCWEGRACIREMLAENLPITIMPGAGVNAEVIEKMLELHDFDAFHASCKQVLNSEMTFRRPGVPMGLPGLDEFSIWQTDEEKVKEAKALLR